MSQPGALSPQNDIIARHVGGETLLVPVRAGQAALDHIFLLNRVAAFVWGELDGQRDVVALAARVRDRFKGAADADVEADVRYFLGELERRGLARPAEQAA